jgi:CoA:oxalate CoA-transferase
VFEAIGAPELITDERFSTRDRRVVYAAEVHALVAEWAAEQTSAGAIAALEAQGVPAAIVRDTAAAVRDPRTFRRGETRQLEHPALGPVEDVIGSGFPVRFSGARAGYESPAPWLGEHNDFVLGGLLGYPPERIDELRAAGAI